MSRFPRPQVSLRDANKLANTNMHNELAAAILAGQPPFVLGDQRPIPSSSLMLPVTCTQDGGGDGTISTSPTYTYKISYNGTDLNTHQTPKNKRTSGSYLVADFGYAHVDPSTGQYVLGLCNETLGVEACSS